MNVNWTLLHFGTIKIPNEGQNQRLFLHRNTYKCIIVNSDLDTRIQICSSRKRGVGILRWPNTKTTFVTFGQSGLQIWHEEYSSRCLEMNSAPQVKRHRLKTWQKNEPSRAEAIWVWISRHVKTSRFFWRFRSIKIPLHWQKLIIVYGTFQYRKNALYCDFKRKNQNSWFGETRVPKSNWAQLENNSGFSRHPRLQCRNGYDSFSIHPKHS